ncbi:hypothetical protein PoB_007428800 [Plakobranchus ocellatus]|uniref:Uncharacterized protein n=1 Tax=Plakobranchus ocellatus TaxID=259542 RepID=A0AAV4DUL6_9GAST|nr:hypothetical protein PoB_007428800 [Plakobranchus ocellatus]
MINGRSSQYMKKPANLGNTLLSSGRTNSKSVPAIIRGLDKSPTATLATLAIGRDSMIMTQHFILSKNAGAGLWNRDIK